MERLIKTFHLEKRIIQNVLRKIDINRSFTNSSCQLPNPSIAHFENIFLPLIETLYIYIYSLSIVSNKQPCFPFSFFFSFFFFNTSSTRWINDYTILEFDRSFERRQRREDTIRDVRS